MIPIALFMNVILYALGQPVGNRCAGVGAVGIGRLIVFIEEIHKLVAVVNVGAGHRIGGNELAVHIDFGVILIAVMTLTALCGSARVGILL